MTKKIEFTKLSSTLQEALTERGHSVAEIEAMSLKRVMEEYAGWELGDPSWGRTFYDIMVQVNTTAAHMPEIDQWNHAQRGG